ncbi:sporulation integral membrane protein YtvI [Thalassobacillus devorans]|uniref:sporulation integral membrane protein YtvI n=1 Tax=Thalassobacillus devorans TaxID=279813 RepID=UPI000490BF67|nr:sporulation integral membrane protein YtvI [Thalassobacillus devorans]
MFRYLTKRQWILIIISVLFIIAAYFLLPVSVPLIAAFVTALFLNPAVRMMQFRFRMKRKLSVIITFLLFLLLISILGTFVVTKTITQVAHLTENAPAYVKQINLMVQDWEESIDRYAQDLPDEFVTEITAGMQSNVKNLSETITNNLTIENITKVFAKIPEYLVSFLVYLIALFLFMLEMPRLKEKAYDHMTEETSEKVKFMNGRLSYVVFGFLKAQFLVSIIIFIVTLIGLLFISPEVAVIMSLIIWAIDFIPIIGSIVILAPWSLYMYLAGDIVTGTKLAILAVLLLAIRRTVEPKVMGRHIGLSPLATLIAMFLGLQLMGIMGFILGPLILIAFNSAKEAGIIRWNYKI